MAILHAWHSESNERFHGIVWYCVAGWWPADDFVTTAGDQILLDLVRLGMSSGDTPEAIAKEVRDAYRLRKNDANLIARQEIRLAMTGGRIKVSFAHPDKLEGEAFIRDETNWSDMIYVGLVDDSFDLGRTWGFFGPPPGHRPEDSRFGALR
jgi:hypothetical protein